MYEQDLSSISNTEEQKAEEQKTENIQSSIGTEVLNQDLGEIRKKINRIVDKIASYGIGSRGQIVLLVLNLLNGGHAIIENTTGMNEKRMITALAECFGSTCRRQRLQKGETRLGMSFYIFSDSTLRKEDKGFNEELLEFMDEEQITFEDASFSLAEPQPILIAQKENAAGGAGILPKSVTEMIALKLILGHPIAEDEIEMIEKDDEWEEDTAFSEEEIEEIRSQIKTVIVPNQIVSYIVKIAGVTRKSHDVKIGSSTQGSAELHKLAQAYALYNGRLYVNVEDIRFLAPYVFAHRLLLTDNAKRAGKRPENMIRNMVGEVLPAPARALKKNPKKEKVMSSVPAANAANNNATTDAGTSADSGKNAKSMFHKFFSEDLGKTFQKMKQGVSGAVAGTGAGAGNDNGKTPDASAEQPVYDAASYKPIYTVITGEEEKEENPVEGVEKSPVAKESTASEGSDAEEVTAEETAAVAETAEAASPAKKNYNYIPVQQSYSNYIQVERQESNFIPVSENDPSRVQTFIPADSEGKEQANYTIGAEPAQKTDYVVVNEKTEDQKVNYVVIDED